MKQNTVRTILSLLCLSLATFAYGRPGSTSTTITYTGYNPADGKFDLTFNINYQLPDPSVFGPGPYPVFMWTPGTFEPYGDPMSTTFTGQMAKRGYLAASVQFYNNTLVQVCSTYLNSSKGVYDAARATSAVSTLCSLPGASCSKGIVTAGISEGAALAVLSRNYAPNVKATLAMSISDFNQQGSINLSSCLDKAHTLIPEDRLMIVNGQSDPLFGGQTPLQNVSGYACPAGTFQCWSTGGNGAGWYIVKNSQVADGLADHCYQMVGGCAGLSFDSSWYLPASYDWSLAPNLDWLASQGTKRTFSPTGQ